jgi:eukaryotic-like serine/threonine-protein kinase
MNNLANIYSEEGKYAEAEPLYRQTLEMRRRVLGAEHPDTLQSMSNLAIVWNYQGEYASAEALYSDAVGIERRVLGPEHPDALRTMNNLANVYVAQGKYAQAETLFTQTLEIRRRLLGQEHPEALLSMTHLANAYAGHGKYPQAQALYAQTLEVGRHVPGSQSAVFNALWGMAYIFLRQGKYALAETYAAENLTRRRHAFGSESAETLGSAGGLARIYEAEGKFAESASLLRKVLESDRVNHREDWGHFSDESVLGASLAGQKKYAEAEPLLLDGYQGLAARKHRMSFPDWYYLDRAREWLVQLYRAWGRPETAAEWSKKPTG